MAKAKSKTSYRDAAAMIESGDHKRYGTIGVRMMQSLEFRALTPGAQLMYMRCRCQSQSPEGRRCLYQYSKDVGMDYSPDRYFVFPSKHMAEYGVDRGNGSKWLKELINKGFLEMVESNKHRHKVNVYSFSTKWIR